MCEKDTNYFKTGFDGTLLPPKSKFATKNISVAQLHFGHQKIIVFIICILEIYIITRHVLDIKVKTRSKTYLHLKYMGITHVL